MRAAEFIGLGEGRRELLRGVVRELPFLDWEGGRIASRIGALLDQHVSGRRLGTVFASGTGFMIGTDPDTVLSPNAGFVSSPNVPSRPHPGFLPTAPDLAVEVVSMDHPLSAVAEKAHTWLDAGTRLVWVVEPQTRRVLVYTPGSTVLDLGVGDVLDGGEVLPGFAVPIDRLFA